MAVRTKAELAAQISNLLADNNTGDISEADVRSVFSDVIDSLIFSPVPAGSEGDVLRITTGGVLHWGRHGQFRGADTLAPTAPGVVANPVPGDWYFQVAANQIDMWERVGNDVASNWNRQQIFAPAAAAAWAQATGATGVIPDDRLGLIAKLLAFSSSAANRYLTIDSAGTGLTWSSGPTGGLNQAQILAWLLALSGNGAGKVLTINSAANGLEWTTVSGGGGGLTEAQVRALIQDWAEEGSSVLIPPTRLHADFTGDGILSLANGVFAKIAEGTNGQVLTIVNGAPEFSNPTGGISTADVLGIVVNNVLSWARTGNSDLIPVTKMATGTDGQVLSMVSGAVEWADAQGGGGTPRTNAEIQDVAGALVAASNSRFTYDDTTNTLTLADPPGGSGNHPIGVLRYFGNNVGFWRVGQAAGSGSQVFTTAGGWLTSSGSWSISDSNALNFRDALDHLDDFYSGQSTYNDLDDRPIINVDDEADLPTATSGRYGNRYQTQDLGAVYTVDQHVVAGSTRVLNFSLFPADTTSTSGFRYQGAVDGRSGLPDAPTVADEGKWWLRRDWAQQGSQPFIVIDSNGNYESLAHSPESDHPYKGIFTSEGNAEASHLFTAADELAIFPDGSGDLQVYEVDSDFVAGTPASTDYFFRRSDVSPHLLQRIDDLEAGSGGSGEANVQADWDETDTASDAFIRNKPTVPGDYDELTDRPVQRVANVGSITPSVQTVGQRFQTNDGHQYLVESHEIGRENRVVNFTLAPTVAVGSAGYRGAVYSLYDLPPASLEAINAYFLSQYTAAHDGYAWYFRNNDGDWQASATFPGSGNYRGAALDEDRANPLAQMAGDFIAFGDGTERTIELYTVDSDFALGSTGTTVYEVVGTDRSPSGVADAELEGNDVETLHDTFPSTETALVRAGTPTPTTAWTWASDVRIPLSRALVEADDGMAVMVDMRIEHTTSGTARTMRRQIIFDAGEFRKCASWTDTTASTLPTDFFSVGGQRIRSGDANIAGAARAWNFTRMRHSDGHDVIRFVIGDSGTQAAMNFRVQVRLIPRVDALSITGASVGAAGSGLDEDQVDDRIATWARANSPSGEAPAARIGNLPASKITSGTFGTARIPGLPASQLTSGTIADARLGTNVVKPSSTGTAIQVMRAISQADYDALTPDANTLYLITS